MSKALATSGFYKGGKRNEQQQLLHYRKGIQEAEMQLYLQEKVYKKLIEISEKNELSISECGQRLMVQSMGLI